MLFWQVQIDILEVPSEHYIYHRTVAWSDTDRYQHTNYISYLIFCYDAAMDAGKAGYFSNFHDDILLYHTQSYAMLYQAESLGGQELVCATWEDEVNKNKLYFSFKRGETLIYQCTIVFYERNLLPEQNIPHNNLVSKSVL